MEQVIPTQKLRLCLSLDESNALKGIALVLLLCHHLFYIQNGLFDDIYISGHGLVNTFGILCKVCVALFVFLSGYGLTASVKKFSIIDWKHFFLHRYIKLYLNYWLIWILFVPFGVFCLDIGFERVYGNDFFLPFIADLTGTINMFGRYGYNPTWWFYSCIIVLYALFPLILKALNRPFVLCAMLVVSLGLILVPITFIQPIKFYLITFILGCLFYKGLIFSKLPPRIYWIRGKLDSVLKGELSFCGCLILWLLLLGMVIFRLKAGRFAMLIDTLIAVQIILIFKNISSKKSHYMFQFLGRHSFNIFLFHTFIYYLYFEEIIYWSKNPIAIFLTLILICVIISYAIETRKLKIKFNKLQDKLLRVI